MNVGDGLRKRLKQACVGGCFLAAWMGLSSFSAGLAQQSSTGADGAVVGDLGPLPKDKADTEEDRVKQAWSMLRTAARDPRHSDTRIQALAALGLMRAAESEALIINGMKDQDLDVRTAAALAAGETNNRNLTSSLRQLLDDKEPQVAFTAATTLWKMGDRSGEDILMAVVDGDRSASPTLLHGTEHRISQELHDPAALARLGALQGASMLLGPFGFGITAYEYLRKNGGDLSRVTAIEAIGQERTEPIRKELVAALGDNDPAVRAASAKALAGYQDKQTSAAVFALMNDPKYPVRLTAAAAFLRTTGVPGPEPVGSPAASARAHRSAKKRR